MQQTIVVTDVTEMHGGQFCVAGWNATLSRMIRPLPEAGNNWSKLYIEQAKLWPGNAVQFNVTGAQSNSEYPHITEDTVISTVSLKFAKPESSASWLKSVVEAHIEHLPHACCRQSVKESSSGRLSKTDRCYCGSNKHSM